MRLAAISAFALAGILAAAPDGAWAQDAQKTAPVEAAKKNPDFITPHISDARHIEVPWPSLKDNLTREIELPRWAPVHIGPLAIDLSPTKHVVMMLLAFAICALALIGAARSQARHAASGRPPSGFAGALEATVLYLRNEIILPSVGHDGEKFVPFCLTLFFFILVMNLLGLLPWGASATGNVSVTATLAICSFIVVEVAGMRALGRKYVSTIVYWPHDMPMAIRVPITLIMTPIELISKFTKPLALTIRLFANMTAGHVLVLALVSLVFTFGAMSRWLVLPPLLAATGIMVLELLVAFLQAFVFTLLTAVFIGQIRESAH
jgi:F-type H+-transporting ATPase subunit a